MTDERNTRKTRQGVVVSRAGDKTAVVAVEDRKAHALYKKMIRHTKKYHVHDEGNVTNVGDVVLIMETRPMSKLKHWRLVEVVEEAK